MDARALPGRCAPRWFASALALPFVACSADDTVTLGRALPDPLFGDRGRAVDKINENGDDEAPTLTEDLLEIYFTSRRGRGPGNGDIWFATRTSRTLAFDDPHLVNEMSTEAVSTKYQELSPAISRDGLTLWLASDRPGTRGGLDIWQTERASRDAEWGKLHNVTELNSTSDDLPRPLGESELVMPLASRREGTQYQIYLARRVSPQVPFSDDAQPIRELRRDGSGMAGGFLTEDGLSLFFQREGQGNDDLYLAWRRSLSEPFEHELPLDGVNDSANDREPFVSSDHTRFFFASNRQAGTGFDIFATTLDLPVFE
jgi:hypothetical protein